VSINQNSHEFYKYHAYYYNMNEKTLILKNGEEWKTSIPPSIFTVLTQRKRIPQTPHVHWYLLVDRKILTFRVTLGNSRGACISELNGYETILPTCVKDLAKGNTIFWSVGSWLGKPFALAKIPELYGKSVISRVLPKGIEIPGVVKEYMNLKARTHLAWKRTENGWIITKNLETHDFETFRAYDILETPTDLKNVSQVKIVLTDYENKPALLLEPLPDRDPFETFLESLHETRIPITRLYLLYRTVENVDYKTFLELIKQHRLETSWEHDTLQYRKKVVIIPHTNEAPTITRP